MRFVIYGAGAIGGVVGGRLFQAGHEVTLIARGDHLRALQRDGLTLASPDATVHLAVPAVANPGEAEPGDGDVVVLAMKSQHTAAAVAELALVAPPDVAVVCAQNGVENERVALRSFPNVYAMAVVMPATHLEPGVVEASSTPVTGVLDLGRYPSGVDQRAVDIAAALSGATISAVARPDIMRWKYRKLIMNLANAAEAVAGAAGRASALPGLMTAEAEAVFAAAGIDAVSAEVEAERRGDLVRLRPVDGRRREGGSSWQSLARGLGTIESDYINGEIALLGRLHGVPTPANDLLQRLATGLAAAGKPPGSLTVDEVLARL
jgi:2-dehydropantoate 2-reductase